jgi:Glycosyltransferase family 87
MIATLKRLVAARSTVLFAFVAAHFWLIWTGSVGPGHPMGDIPFAYRPWADQMLQSQELFGLTTKWVYPFPDLIPTLLPALVPWLDYQSAWLSMAFLVNLGAMAVLLFWPFRFDIARVTAGWFWVAALVVLGPVAISRIDTISVAIVVVGLVAWLQAKPATASVWFAVATWVKVWPIALLSATILEAKAWKRALFAGVGTGVGILLFGLLWGKPSVVLGFVTEQTARGIQIESPWATWWLWQGVNKVPGSGLYYSTALNTFQVKGPGTELIATLLGPTTYLALMITMVLGWLAIRRNQPDSNALRNEIFTWTVFTAVLDLIVFNKVGSPQYYGWLIIPAVLGLIQRVPNWGIIWPWVLATLALTGIIYPTIYDSLLSQSAWATAVLGIRNLSVLALLVIGNTRLMELVRRG